MRHTTRRHLIMLQHTATHCHTLQYTDEAYYTETFIGQLVLLSAMLDMLTCLT